MPKLDIKDKRYSESQVIENSSEIFFVTHKCHCNTKISMSQGKKEALGQKMESSSYTIPQTSGI